MIYAAEQDSTAMLEKLAHAQGRLPPNRHSIEITLRRGLTCEMGTKDGLPGWDNEDGSVATVYCRQWVIERRSAALLVASFVARVSRTSSSSTASTSNSSGSNRVL